MKSLIRNKENKKIFSINVDIDSQSFGIINTKPVIGSEMLKYQPGREKFRIHAKNLFLVYSKINLVPYQVLAQLQKRFSYIDKYIISHTDETKFNEEKKVYAYIELDKKINIINPNKLVLVESISGNISSPEYFPVKDKDSIINQVKKMGSFICNFETDMEFEFNLQKIAIELGLDKAMEYFCEKKPEFISSKYNLVRSNLKSFLSLRKLKIF